MGREAPGVRMKGPGAWLVTLLAVRLLALPGAAGPEPVRIGILHSLTGPRARLEAPLVDGARLAAEEENARGGVLGRPIEARVADGASRPEVFSREAGRLLDREGVNALFGCWASHERKAVIRVVEPRRRLLFYPMQYEGMEESPWTIYSGAAPNQQLLPAVDWCLRQGKRRFFLLGSDTLYSRGALRALRSRASARGGTIVGEVSGAPERIDFPALGRRLRDLRPDVVLNTLDGEGNQLLFAALAAEGLGARQLPVLSFTLGENALRDCHPLPVGHLSAWNYFQSLDTPENRAFVTAFRARFGPERVVDDPIETSYFQVRAWALAVRRAGSLEPEAVRRALRGLVLEAPEGLVRIDPRNQHTWRVARLGRVRADGQFDLVWASDLPLRPEPGPPRP